MDKFTYWKVLRITAFLKRFVNNCKAQSKGGRDASGHMHHKLTGPLTTEEIKAAEAIWIKMVQGSAECSSIEQLKPDKDSILRYDGRVPGHNPIYLPRQHKLTNLIIQHSHKSTFHGGVSMVMCDLRLRFWIPKLRSLVKKVVQACNTCRRYKVKPLVQPAKSYLPEIRSTFTEPFAVSGVDFAGPMVYKLCKNETGKSYIALFTCASTRAVHLKLLPDLSAQMFKIALKEFVARRGFPQIIVSDNAKTFLATKKWLSTLKKDESLMNYITSKGIKWQFNLARAPWWGGFFERLIGIMKNTLSKALGRGFLRFYELEEVLLDVECTMNNRPLCYQGEEFEEPVLTPNILLRGRPAILLEEDFEFVEDENAVTKRMKHLAKQKAVLRKRWTQEYLHALEERQSKSSKGNPVLPTIGDVVLLKEDVKNRGAWKIGRIVKNVRGNDGVIRGFKIQLGNGYIVERPIQLVCNLEIGGAGGVESPKQGLNPMAKEFQPRERLSRLAKKAAAEKIREMMKNEDTT